MYYNLTYVGLDICRIVFGSPYLYDRKAIFRRDENMHHLFKNGIDYIVRAHHKKMNLSLVSVGQMKRLVNSSKNFVLLLNLKLSKDVILNSSMNWLSC